MPPPKVNPLPQIQLLNKLHAWLDVDHEERRAIISAGSAYDWRIWLHVDGVPVRSESANDLMIAAARALEGFK